MMPARAVRAANHMLLAEGRINQSIFCSIIPPDIGVRFRRGDGADQVHYRLFSGAGVYGFPLNRNNSRPDYG
jgi:hypothetical protein